VPGTGWHATVADGRVRRLLRRGSVRLRTTVVATLVVAVAMVVGAVVLVGLLRASLEDGVEDAVDQRLESTVEALDGGQSPSEVVGDDDDRFVQVTAADGHVLASSTDDDEEAPRVDADVEGTTTVESPEGERFLVSSDDATVDGDDVTVVVGESTEDVDESASTATRLLLIGVPVLVVFVGVATWFVVGRAFAPVDRITREVDEISGADLHRRVSAPPSGDEIGRLARTMNRMLERLDAAARRQREFVSDASHELRSPTASLRQHAEIALAYPDRADAASLADTVQAESIRLQRIIDGLLLLARIDERSQAVQSQPVDVDDLVLVEARRLRTTTELDVDTSAVAAARVRGDEGMLAHIVRNLADNAARHASSRVALAVGEDRGDVLLTVDDDGAGIPADQRERVFDRFVRLDEARARDDGGSGLGLAIVRELARLHGGTVQISESQLGGACFEVRVAS